MTGQPSKPNIVVIVEDDADLRGLMASLIEEIQLEVIECESAEAALAVMLLRGREIAVVLSDIQLPGAMDGVDFAREAKLRWPHLPFVLTSGNTGTRLDKLPLGVTYVPKPWKGEQILAIVETARSLTERRSRYGR